MICVVIQLLGSVLSLLRVMADRNVHLHDGSTASYDEVSSLQKDMFIDGFKLRDDAIELLFNLVSLQEDKAVSVDSRCLLGNVMFLWAYEILHFSLEKERDYFQRALKFIVGLLRRPEMVVVKTAVDCLTIMAKTRNFYQTIGKVYIHLNHVASLYHTLSSGICN